MSELCINPGSVFIDSGAWSMYQLHVLKSVKKSEEMTGKVKNEKLAKSSLTNTTADFSFYNLKRGSEFRKYCDDYAEYIRGQQRKGVKWFATLDVIGNAKLTWEVQEYFEKEHEIIPLPIIHFGQHPKWLARYLEKGYDMIGIGGLARQPNRKWVISWADEAFRMICPASNNRLPLTRVHGFAVTAWEYLLRWPWYSVDSTSFILYGSYGMLLVPPFKNGLNEDDGFNMDHKPKVISVSAWGRKIDYDSKIHVTNTFDLYPMKAKPRGVDDEGLMLDLSEGASAHFSRPWRENTFAWLDYIKADLGENDREGNVIKPGVSNSSDLRTAANIRYYMELEDHLPKWPCPLDNTIAKSNEVVLRRGFGF